MQFWPCFIVASNPSNFETVFHFFLWERWRMISRRVLPRMATTTARVTVVVRRRDRFDSMPTEYTISSTSATPVLSNKPRNCIPLFPFFFLSLYLYPCLFPSKTTIDSHLSWKTLFPLLMLCLTFGKIFLFLYSEFDLVLKQVLFQQGPFSVNSVTLFLCMIEVTFC